MKKYIFLFTLLCFASVTAVNLWAAGIRWRDYTDCIHGLEVWYSEDTVVIVNLPASFVKSDDVSLELTLFSLIPNRKGVRRRRNFTGYAPIIKINDHFRDEIRVPVDIFPGIQKHTIQIKPENLITGKNKITVKFDLESRFENICTSINCHFMIIEMCFGSTARSASSNMAALNRPSHVLKKATRVIKGHQNYYELWYDPQKWFPLKKPYSDDRAETHELIHHRGGLHTIVRSYLRPVDLNDFYNDILLELSEGVPDIVFKDNEVIKIQGQTLIKAELRGNVNEVPHVFLVYCWTGPKKSFLVLSRIPEWVSEEDKPELSEFLKGIVIKAGDES